MGRGLALPDRPGTERDIGVCARRLAERTGEQKHELKVELETECKALQQWQSIMIFLEFVKSDC